MSQITRVCTHCGQSSPLDAQFCPHCGYDTQSGLPAPQNNSLPLALGKAALPVVVGVAGLVVRAGWQLLKSRLAHAVTPTALASQKGQAPAPRAATTPQRARRTIHIRSAWAVGDARGVWRKGESEHTIEIEE